MTKNRSLSRGALTVLCAFFFTALSCTPPTNPEPVTEPTATLSDYGVNTNIGPRTMSGSSVALAETVHPLTSKNVVVQSFKEIITTGLTHSNNGSGSINFVVDDTAQAAFSEPVNEDGDTSWTKWPHASCATDLNGDGIQEVTTILFEPTDTTKGLIAQAETKGKAKIKILRKNASKYERTDIVVPFDFSLFLGAIDARKNFAMDIDAGDIDGDGCDEIAIAVGNIVTIVKIQNNVAQLVLTPIDYHTRDTSAFWGFRPTYITMGDIDGDGKSDLLTCDGKDNGATYTAAYELYVSTGSTLVLKNSGVVSNNTNSVQIANPMIGDIDNDGQAEAAFVGDFDDGTYSAVLAFEWNTSLSQLQAVTLSSNFLKAHNGWVYKTPLKLLSSDVIVDGATKKLNRVVINNQITEYSPNGGFSTVATIASNASNCMMDIGDVNRDGQDEVVYISNAGVETLEVFGKNSAGNWVDLNSLVYYADIGSNPYFSLTVADLDGDSQVLQYIGHEIKFTEPEVVGVLASVPFYTEFGAGNNAYTSFGRAKSLDTENTHSLTISASNTIGVSVDAPLWGSVGSSEISMTLEASFSTSFGNSVATSESRTFKADGGEDHVLFTSIPYDVYSYKVLRWSADENAEPANWTRKSSDRLDICLPRTPQILPMERTKFNEIAGNPIKVDASVLSHTIGKPSTYPTLAAIKNFGTSGSNPLAKGFIDSTGFTVIPSGSGAYEYEFAISNSSNYSIGGGLSLTREMQTVSCGLLIGASQSLGYEYQRSVSMTSASVVGAGIPYLPATSASDKTFTTGVAAYSQKIPGQQGNALIINYWVN